MEVWGSQEALEAEIESREEKKVELKTRDGYLKITQILDIMLNVLNSKKGTLALCNSPLRSGTLSRFCI